MYTKLLTVIFLITFSSLSAGAAEPAHKQYKSCVDTCYIEQMACQFENDLDTCQSNVTQCARTCENRFPAVALCLNDCESYWTFCRYDGYSLQSVCLQEKLACSNRCEVPNTVSQNGR